MEISGKYLRKKINKTRRKIIRRATIHLYLLGIKTPLLFVLSDIVVTQMQSAYPTLKSRITFISNTIYTEEEKFMKHLVWFGVNHIDKLLKKLGNPTKLRGDLAF